MLGEAERDLRRVGVARARRARRRAPSVLVAVGRRVEEAQEVAPLDLLSPELDVGERGAAHVRDRRDVPEELLDRTGHELGLGGEDRPLVGVLGQRLAGAGEETTSGLVAGDQQDLRHRELLFELERLPLPFGLGEHR